MLTNSSEKASIRLQTVCTANSTERSFSEWIFSIGTTSGNANFPEKALKTAEHMFVNSCEISCVFACNSLPVRRGGVGWRP